MAENMRAGGRWRSRLSSLVRGLLGRVAATPHKQEPSPDHLAVAARLPDPCFIVDGRAHIQFENEPAARLFGRIGRGKPLTFLLRAPELTETVQRAIDEDAPQTVTYHERVPGDRWYEARVAPIGEGARSDLFLIVLRDLTEAQRVERMRVDFIANVSHELRTPLASLTGFIETLQGPAREDPEARDRFLDVMAQQAWRMSRLIDDLLSLSRIELRSHVQPEDEVDLAIVLDHVVEAMRPVASEQDMELTLDLGTERLDVRGDRDELAQLFQNLVHNAIKYGQEGKRVDVSAAREKGETGKPDRIRISVRDHGPGIPEEHIPRLTERFYRVDTATSRERGGTGLGLAIVKHVLNRHRGHLAIESVPGAGATFTVRLDALEQQPVAEL